MTGQPERPSPSSPAPPVARRLRSRLALRIYLAGLAQTVAVVLGFTLLLRALPPPVHPGTEREARFVTEGVVAKLGDEAALARELERVRRGFDATLTIYDDEGRVIASTDPGAPALPAEALPPLGPQRPSPGGPGDAGGPASFGPSFVAAVQLPGGRAGRAVYRLPHHAAPPRHDSLIVAVILIVVGVSSLLTARSLAKPLARLSSAARSFGAGRLDARSGLARSDEIGDVAAAFDEMAARVTELLRSEKELIANVSHELRTPLARIRVALDLAVEGDAEVARQSLGEIAADLEELERLISDVLTAARLDLGDGAGGSGIPPLRHERVDLVDLLAHSASRLRSAHPSRTLVTRVAPTLPIVDGDRVLLRRAIDNLLENAHKYSPRADAEVELRAALDGQGVLIEVIDRGVGISAEDLPRVFRPFFRADKSRTRATGGLGLGLALARRIVEAHGGAIAIESVPGEGTRASVRLPAAPVDA